MRWSKSAKESLNFRALSYPCVLGNTKGTRHVPYSSFPAGAGTVPAAIIVHHPRAKYYTVGESRVEQLAK